MTAVEPLAVTPPASAWGGAATGPPGPAGPAGPAGPPISISRVKANRTAVQVLTNNAWTPLLWNSELYDTDGMHNTVTNTDRLTAVTAGDYAFTLVTYMGDGVYPAAGTGIMSSRVFRRNSAGVDQENQSVYLIMIAGIGLTLVNPGTMRFSAGDYLISDLYQNGTGTWNLQLISSFEMHQIA